jgi:curli biogenesis system outer membrane secretion channel CsgG
MTNHRSFCSKALVWLSTAMCCSTAQAQERAAAENKPLCPAVVATVLVSRPTCTASLCNTGAAQGGFTGLVALAMNRQSIDAASFSTGVGAMLSTALKQTGCFTVFDAAGIEDVRKEMESLGKPAPAPPTVDYVVRASVTKADLLVDETTIMLFKKTTTTSSLTIDTKLVSSALGTVFEAGSHDASSEWSTSGVPGIYTSGNDSRKNTPFADVARDAVTKAAAALTGKILAQARTTAVSSPAAQPLVAPQLPASAAQ